MYLNISNFSFNSNVMVIFLAELLDNARNRMTSGETNFFPLFMCSNKFWLFGPDIG